MKTPIVDFVSRYIKNGTHRCHMPGHKGQPLLGCEPLDLTEIHGADDLYHASGIIAESEANASSLFGSYTLYSTEGSSHCIRAMLDLLCRYAAAEHRPARILAGRNAHKVFVSAAAVLGIEVEWLYGETPSYLSCPISPDALEEAIVKTNPTAVYLTSPDYIGHVADIAALAAVCHKHGVLLMVDNAHGAYLRFLSPSRHPIDLGADLCCDSAHKTLPALTGASYLHVAHTAPALFKEQAKSALSRYGSTSPSYLILQSLDRVNAYLADGYSDKLLATSRRVDALRNALHDQGLMMVEEEPLKLTLLPKSFGYTGNELAQILRGNNVECEFSDPDHAVLMFTPESDSFDAVETILTAVERRSPITTAPPQSTRAEQAVFPKDTLFCPRETVAVSEAVGRILAEETVGCPPAVPIVVCGECITKEAIDAFHYYGIDTCVVMK